MSRLWLCGFQICRYADMQGCCYLLGRLDIWDGSCSKIKETYPGLTLVTECHVSRLSHTLVLLCLRIVSPSLLLPEILKPNAHLQNQRYGAASKPHLITINENHGIQVRYPYLITVIIRRLALGCSLGSLGRLLLGLPSFPLRLLIGCLSIVLLALLVALLGSG